MKHEFSMVKRHPRKHIVSNKELYRLFVQIDYIDNLERVK